MDSLRRDTEETKSGKLALAKAEICENLKSFTSGWSQNKCGLTSLKINKIGLTIKKQLVFKEGIAKGNIVLLFPKQKLKLLKQLQKVCYVVPLAGYRLRGR